RGLRRGRWRVERRSSRRGARRGRGGRLGISRERAGEPSRGDRVGDARGALRTGRLSFGRVGRARGIGPGAGLVRLVIEILCVVGARPNFMKMAPILSGLSKYPGIRPFLVHTGQHYDEEMSRVFFQELGLPAPDKDLEVGSDSHARQTARIMTAFEPLVEAR